MFPHVPHFLLAQVTAAHPGGLRGFVDTAARTPLSQIVLGAVVFTILRSAIYPYLQNTPGHLRFGVYKSVKMVNEFCDAVIYAGIFVFMVIRPFILQAFLVPSGSMWPTIYVNDFIVANKAIYRYTEPQDADIVVFRPPVRATWQYPDELDPDGTVNVDFVKRCMGVPGDVVELRKGVYYRNGVKVDDPYGHYSTTTDNVNFTELPADQVAQLVKPSFKFIIWKGNLIPLSYVGTEANSANPVAFGQPQPYEVHPDFVLKPSEMAAAIAAPAQPIPKGYYFMMGDDRNNSDDGRVWGLVPRDSIIGRSEFIWLPINRINRTR